MPSVGSGDHRHLLQRRELPGPGSGPTVGCLGQLAHNRLGSLTWLLRESREDADDLALLPYYDSTKAYSSVVPTEEHVNRMSIRGFGADNRAGLRARALARVRLPSSLIRRVGDYLAGPELANLCLCSATMSSILGTDQAVVMVLGTPESRGAGGAGGATGAGVKRATTMAYWLTTELEMGEDSLPEDSLRLSRVASIGSRSLSLGRPSARLLGHLALPRIEGQPAWVPAGVLFCLAVALGCAGIIMGGATGVGAGLICASAVAAVAAALTAGWYILGHLQLRHMQGSGGAGVNDGFGGDMEADGEEDEDQGRLGELGKPP